MGRVAAVMEELDGCKGWLNGLAGMRAANALIP